MIDPLKLNKSISLAPIVGDPPDRGQLDGEEQFRRFDLESNLEGYGHLSQNGGPGFFAETNATVARLWVDWWFLQMEGPNYFRPRVLEAIDSNIQAAKNAGLDVILVAKRFPPWANYAGVQAADGRWTPVGETEDDHEAYASELEARDPASAQRLRRLWSEFGYRDALVRDNNPGSFRFPVSSEQIAVDDIDESGVALSSAWGQWITFLAYRYHPNPFKRGDTKPNAPARLDNAWVDYIEFVNEPNFECWPQKPSGKTLRSARLTAAMFRTVVEIERLVNEELTPTATRATTQQDQFSTPMRFAGPATSDIRGVTDASTASYDLFLIGMANALQTKRGRKFLAGPNIAFTHHNYGDIKNRRTRAPSGERAGSETNSSAWVVRLLRKGVGTRRGRGWWQGWPQGIITDAGVLLTEGGHGQKRVSEAERRRRLRDGFEVLRATSRGRGVALFTNFLSWEDRVPAGAGRTSSHLVKQTFRLDGGTPRTVDSLGREPNPQEYAACKLQIYTTWKGLSTTKEPGAQ